MSDLTTKPFMIQSANIVLYHFNAVIQQLPGSSSAKRSHVDVDFNSGVVARHIFEKRLTFVSMLKGSHST